MEGGKGVQFWGEWDCAEAVEVLSRLLLLQTIKVRVCQFGRLFRGAYLYYCNFSIGCCCDYFGINHPSPSQKCNARTSVDQVIDPVTALRRLAIAWDISASGISFHIKTGFEPFPAQ